MRNLDFALRRLPRRARAQGFTEVLPDAPPDRAIEPLRRFAGMSAVPGRGQATVPPTEEDRD